MRFVRSLLTALVDAAAADVVEVIVMRGSGPQYPMMPSAQPPHSFPVVVHAGAVPHQQMMHLPPARVALPQGVHAHYAFQPSMYGLPVVRYCHVLDQCCKHRQQDHLCSSVYWSTQ